MRRCLPSILLLAIITLITSCNASLEQQYHSGDYDAAIRNALEKMHRGRKRDESVSLAVKAYNLAMKDDKQRIANLKAQNTENQNWGKIYYLYKHMDRRQRAVEPYLPFQYSDGRKVNIELHDLGPVISEARIGAADYHYFHATRWLETGGRKSGRNAYDHLNELCQYFDPYKDSRGLMEQAIEMGTNKVLIRFGNNNTANVPIDFMEELAAYDYENSIGHWTRLYRQTEYHGTNLDWDYVIDIDIESVQMSPGHTREVHYDKKKEIQDGFKPLLNAQGQVVLDTAGQVIQVPKYITLHCHVVEWSQARSAQVNSVLLISDSKRSQTAVRQRLEDQAVFENVYAQANGHIDILPAETKRLLQNRPLPFPTDRDMIWLTSPALKKQIADAIHRNRDIISNI